MLLCYGGNGLTKRHPHGLNPSRNKTHADSNRHETTRMRTKPATKQHEYGRNPSRNDMLYHADAARAGGYGRPPLPYMSALYVCLVCLIYRRLRAHSPTLMSHTNYTRYWTGGSGLIPWLTSALYVCLKSYMPYMSALYV